MSLLAENVLKPKLYYIWLLHCYLSLPKKLQYTLKEHRKSVV